MEKQQLEKIIEDYELWNHGGYINKYLIRTTRGLIQRNEYAMVATDSKELMESADQGKHYHYGSELYLIYKPGLVAKKISKANYRDWNFSYDETYTNMNLDEQENQLIVKYDYNFHDGNKKSQIKNFREIARTKKGEIKPKFEIMEIE